MTWKIALAGIGKIARDQHVPSIAASADFELAATVTRHEGVDDIENYTDIDAMLEARPDIEVVSLCLPPVPRFEYAAAAIKAGRHVMLEKPPGATLAECHALETMAREAGVSIFATWHSREAASVEAARSWLAGKTLKSLKITWLEDVRRWHPGQAWIWEPGGLGVFDPGINALSILTRILQTPVHLASATLKFPENRQTPIAADLVFRHPDNASVSASFDWRKEGDQYWNIEAETDHGTMVLSAGGADLSINGSPVDTSGVALEGEYPNLYKRMAELLKTGEIDMDLSPMVHVADAFLLGKREIVEPFDE